MFLKYGALASKWVLVMITFNQTKVFHVCNKQYMTHCMFRHSTLHMFYSCIYMNKLRDPQWWLPVKNSTYQILKMPANDKIARMYTQRSIKRRLAVEWSIVSIWIISKTYCFHITKIYGPRSRVSGILWWDSGILNLLAVTSNLVEWKA